MYKQYTNNAGYRLHIVYYHMQCTYADRPSLSYPANGHELKLFAHFIAHEKSCFTTSSLLQFII